MPVAPWAGTESILILPPSRRTPIAGALVLALLGCSGNGHTRERGGLGGYPLCEASAARVVPCESGAGRCLIVGDDERRTELFVLALDGTRPVAASRRSLPFAQLLGALPVEDREISDIEAFAAPDRQGLLIVGSHSRTRSCEPRRNRERSMGVRYEGRTLLQHADWPFRQSASLPLFEEERSSEAMRAVAAAIARAEGVADRAKGDRQACNAIGAFNIEGAVAVGQDDARRIWYGLRSPTVDGRAVLLRRATRETGARFDAVAMLNLGGSGVRDLAAAGNAIGLIAGPADRVSETPFRLMRFPVAALQPDAVVEPEFVSNLPGGAEGLAIEGASAIVVMDGAPADAGEQHCTIDASYVVVPFEGSSR